LGIPSMQSFQRKSFGFNLIYRIVHCLDAP
jgi:hypothetical protein